MDQEQYLKNRLQKALRIADELNYMIEHTLISSSGKIEEAFVKNKLELENSSFFQGNVLYKIMKNFLDYSFHIDENGSYPEELINSYLEDMDEFSLSPKVSGDVFEFKIQDHVYKIEVIMNGIVGMTLLINDEWIQTRVIKSINDFSAVMRILDNVKGIYETNPYEDEEEFVKFYNKVVKIADEEALEWRDVEKKVFVPYSKVNDIYFSPYNSKQFFADFFEELEISRKCLDEIEDSEDRKIAEAFIAFLFESKDNFSIENSFDMSNFFSNHELKEKSVFASEFFQNFLGRLIKKHSVLNRLKELAEELKTFSDLKSIDEQNEEAEKEYGYEAVKQYLINKDKDKFLAKAVIMTPIDSVNLAKYVALQSDEFIQERADIFLEVATREILPLQAEEIKKLSTILASDPINLIKKIVPESESFFEGKDIEFTAIDTEEVDRIIEEDVQAEKIYDEHEKEYEQHYRDIAVEVYDEMEKLQEKGEIERKDFDETGEISEYYKVVMKKSLEKLMEKGLMKKIMEEVTKK